MSRYQTGFVTGMVVMGTGLLVGQGRILEAAAHRLAFEQSVAPIPPGMMVLHICDNRTCINPDHLVLGTHRANMADMKAKKRSPFGARHVRAALTDEQAAQALDMWNKGVIQRDIAREFRVARSTITKLLNGSTYGGRYATAG